MCCFTIDEILILYNKFRVLQEDFAIVIRNLIDYLHFSVPFFDVNKI